MRYKSINQRRLNALRRSIGRASRIPTTAFRMTTDYHGTTKQDADLMLCSSWASVADGGSALN